MNPNRENHQPSLTARGKTRHIFWLGLFLVPWLVAPFLVATSDSMSLTGVEGPGCFAVSALGFECPGCGLSRGAVMIIHGEWASAWQVNPAAFLVLVLCLGGAALHAEILLRNRILSRHNRMMLLGKCLFLAGIGSVWINKLTGGL